jgi:hypothetical protein
MRVYIHFKSFYFENSNRENGGEKSMAEFVKDDIMDEIETMLKDALAKERKRIKRRSRKRQLVAMLLLSVVGAAFLIAHGVIFDLDLSQIYRLSIGGFLATMPAVFISLLILEWVFSLA